MDRSQSINNKAVLQPYKTAISRYFRSLLALKGVTYPELSEKLESRGIILTPENLRNKVSRGLLSADLFIFLIDLLEENAEALNVLSGLAEGIAETATE